MSVKRNHQAGPNSTRERGGIAIMFGLTLAVLIGFAGLVIDLGRFFVIKAELQNAMDACALAASTQLRPGQNNPNALTRAVAYGQVFSTGGKDDPLTTPLEGNIGAIKNLVNFQSTLVNVAASQITFADTLDGSYQTSAGANPNTAAFVKCTYPLANLPIYLMNVINPSLTTQTVSAMAAATLAPSASSCAIPTAVCKAPGTTAASNFGLTVGEWMTRPSGGGSAYGKGHFGWIDFTPPGGGSSETADLFTSSGYCGAKTGDPVGESGNKENLVDAWNSRFGLYKQKKSDPASIIPDVTGYAYSPTNWPEQSNAYSGSSATGALNYKAATAAYRTYQANSDFPTPNGYGYFLNSAEHQQFGRTRRVTVAPIVDCDKWAAGVKSPPIEGFACVLMLDAALKGKADDNTYRLEFLGLSTVAGSVCSTNGEPGTYGPLVPQLVQ